MDLNLTLCFPDMPAADRRRLGRHVLAENGATVLEMFSIWRWLADRLAPRLTGKALCDSLSSREHCRP